MLVGQDWLRASAISRATKALVGLNARCEANVLVLVAAFAAVARLSCLSRLFLSFDSRLLLLHCNLDF